MTGNGEPVTPLAWDSGFFGLRIARYARPGMDAEEASEVESLCNLAGVDCMYFLADPHDAGSLESARSLGMRITGIRLVFRKRPISGFDEENARGIRPASAEDLPVLKRLASTLHTTTRFFLDPGFDRSKAGELYSIWLENSLHDPDCMLLSAGEPGSPTGYCLARLTADGASTLELLGVEPGLRGTGLGKALMLSGLGWLASMGAGDASLVTQGGGPGLIAFYERNGFTVESVKLWFHYWPSLRHRP